MVSGGNGFWRIAGGDSPGGIIARPGALTLPRADLLVVAATGLRDRPRRARGWFGPAVACWRVVGQGPRTRRPGRRSIGRCSRDEVLPGIARAFSLASAAPPRPLAD